jgi:uncharacterized protein (DUF2147 family)
MLLALPMFLNAQKDEIIASFWNNEKTSQIRIFLATDGQYYGKIDWMENPEKKDVNNPYKDRRDNNLMGLIILRNFKYDAKKNRWTGGTIYDPDNGKVYDCYFWFEGGNIDVLYLKGYVLGMKWMGRETTWTRVKKE